VATTPPIGKVTPLLELVDLTAGYGGGAVLRGVNLKVERGTIACIVGPNGAGKSTVFRAVSGLLEIMGGSILVDGQRTDQLTSAEITKAGIAQVPQSNGLFPTLTVKENVLMGAYLIRRQRALVKERYEHVAALYPVVGERARHKSRNQYGGPRRMVEFARALMLDPKLVLLDEPSVGLDPIILAQVKEAILTMNQTGKTVILVEQNVRFGFSVSTEGIVMESGRVLIQAPAKELLENPEMGQLFFGGVVKTPAADDEELTDVC
jgi:ABC-type branched-subunit amino acid transport system ATPase component